MIPGGKRRDPNTWLAYEEIPEGASVDRGFTGHEHLDLFELVNMNGRIYDPVIARFLSPDPFIQSPDNSQGLNRYSYAWNNPLVVIDPSGYNNQWLLIGVAVVAIAVSIVSYGALTGPAIGMYVGCAALIAGAAGGFVGGVLSTLAMGGNIGDALVSGLKGAAIGAYTAGLTFGIGSAVGTIGNAYVQGIAKVAAHGAFNGMRSLSQG
jgi:RHS repeat-associated protein